MIKNESDGQRIDPSPQYAYDTIQAHVQRLKRGQRDGHLRLVVRVLVQVREVGVQLAREGNIGMRLLTADNQPVSKARRMTLKWR